MGKTQNARRKSPAAGSGTGPFRAGALVLVTLTEPREKFWGAVLELTPAGLSLRGIELASFDDSAAMVRAGELFTPTAVFFPMHRVERMELDLPEGAIPSLAQRFAEKTGVDATTLLSAEPARRRGTRP